MTCYALSFVYTKVLYRYSPCKRLAVFPGPFSNLGTEAFEVS